MSELLMSYMAPHGSVEIRICQAPPNTHHWRYMWAIVQVEPTGATRILTGTGQHGNPGSPTLADALTAAGKAYVSFEPVATP
jgi:hypothetical protein